MANLNKVILIGRVVADPDLSRDVIKFQNGGKVTRIRFVVNNRKFNGQTQQWEDDPVWLDLKFFNRGENGKLADRAEQLRKPQSIWVEGHLVLEKWTDKDGQERTKVLVYVDAFQNLDRRDDGGGFGGDGASMGGSRPAQQQRNNGGGRIPARSGGSSYSNGNAGTGEDDSFSSGGGGNDDDIPF